MKIKIDASYFSLKCKPNLLRPLNLNNLKNQLNITDEKQQWQFKFLESFYQVDQGLNQLKYNISQLLNQNGQNQTNTTQIKKFDFFLVNQLLLKIKTFLEKIQYYNITLTNQDFLLQNSALYQLCQFPQSFKICTLLTEVQKLLQSVQKGTKISEDQKRLPFSFQLLKKVTVKQIPNILKFLKQNLYIPSTDLFKKLLEKFHLRFDESMTIVQNMDQNKLGLHNIQNIQLYYLILIHKSCSTVEGLCHFLTFTKNILLDRKSGALAADHQIWVSIYQICIRLYVRNPEIRQNKWLEIDQILSTPYVDEEFTNFLLTESINQFSLQSINFYIKNLNKPEQQKLYDVVQEKILSLFESGLCWKYAQDIVEHLDSQCPSEAKQQIYNKIIALIDSLFINEKVLEITNGQFFQLQTGLTFFIESMCRNLHVTQKIFNASNMKLIIQILTQSHENQKKIRLVHRIFTQFIINSFQQSDELTSYLQKNQQIVKEIIPIIIKLFKSHNFNLPKQLYKIAYHSVKDIENLDPIFWKGIAELYFSQSFQETIDLEIFHNDNQSKKKIVDEVVILIKQLTINNSKENLSISENLKQGAPKKDYFKAFLELKSFKDELIFNNVLMMSTYFGQFLPLSQLSQILNEFYTPLVSDIKWKSAQTESLTILSFLSQELPIDVLKVTYKFLKNGYSIDIQNLNSLSINFWNLYLSNESENKVKAILNQKQLTFESYENLHSLKNLELVLNMVNCVFDKLNQHSQKSIKQLKIMYQWGVEYIEQLHPYIYSILIQNLSKSFASISKNFNNQNVDTFEIYNRSKNISVLDFHLCTKYHIFQTFHDFNKIGQVIQHEKALKIASLLHPCFTKDPQKLSQIFDEQQILRTIFYIFVLMQNSCLEEVMNDSYLIKVSKIHIESDHYFEKAHKIFLEFKKILQVSTSQTKLINIFLQNPLYKRLISHLKLLMGKIYLPYIVRLAFQSSIVNSKDQQLKSLEIKFLFIKTAVEIIYRLDPLFEEHFAQLMQVIEQNCENSQKKQKIQLTNQDIKAQILIKTLQMFIQCVLSNIKVRSFHIFKLIKLYLSETKTQIQPINQVIKFYIDLLFGQFLNKEKYRCFNEQVKEKSISGCKRIANDNETARVKILTLHKNKEHLNFADKILSPLKKDKISLEDLKMKKHHKSGFQSIEKNQKQQFEVSNQSQQIPKEFKKLIIREHSLNTAQTSCTLSMFINLFARLNFSSLPSGVQAMLSRQNDKIVYLDYLMELTDMLKSKECSDMITSREMQILNIDVYGNLSCVLKGKINENILNKFVKLSKKTLQLSLPEQSIVTLPIKLLNQRLFHRPPKKLSTSETNLNDFYQVSKLISEFQQEPLAFELSIKSHLLKIFPFIKSNLHICNLQYIVGSSKTSVAKKILQTNQKLIQSILGRNLSKQFLKKYQKASVKKQTLQISLSPKAIQQIDKILLSFTQAYESITQQNQQKVIRLYFYFRKICSIMFFAPELSSHILTKRLKINDKQITFLETIFESLSYTLVFFCEFYVVCLKINSGFCNSQELTRIIQETSQNLQYKINEKLQKVTGQIPLNIVLEIYLKLKLLRLTRQGENKNLNALRGLSFTIKQSQKFRFRFYKFIKINSAQHEDLIRKVDEQILQFLLAQLNDKHKNSKQKQFSRSLVNKIQVMDLCLQNILSHTMVDYAKMKLDDKLKETFYHSQYSIKCLQSMSNDINTLKVLEQDDEEKSFSSTDGLEIEEVESSTIIDAQWLEDGNKISEKNKQLQKNVFQGLQIIRLLENGNTKAFQLSKGKVQTQFFPLIEICADNEMFSAKQTEQMKQWLSVCTSSNDKEKIGSVLLRQMQRSCDKLTGKQSLTFTFEDAVYLDPQHTDQLQITAFAISQNSNISSDCCIQQTSLAQIPVDEGGIIESTNSISEQVNQNERNEGIVEDFNNDQIKQEDDENNDQIIQNDEQCDGIVEQLQNDDQEHITQNQREFDVKISIVEETHVNKFKSYENQNGDSIVQMQGESNIQIEEHQQELVSGTDGSIEFTSIKTLGLNEEIHLQQISQQLIHDTQPHQLSPPQILLNGSQQRQYRYTIDNLTIQSSNKLIQNASLIDSLENQVLGSSQLVTKQSIFTLIEQYTLNPQVLRIIKLKLKKISNTELKKVQSIVFGDLKDQVEKQMRSRGIYVALSPRNYQDQPEGSLFSINKFINQTFQVDQSKFYAANYKRCDKRTVDKQKIQKIPKLTFNEWTYFVFIYLIKTKQTQLKNKLETNTLLQEKGLNDLLIKMLCNKQNLLEFLEVLLNLLSFDKTQQITLFFEKHTGLRELSSKYDEVFNNLASIILNDLIAKLIVNRIGLPVIFKGKWNYDTRKLIRYEFSCLVSDSNLSSNRSQGDPLLQVFLRKAIQIIYNRQLCPTSEKTNNDSQNNFVKSLTEYFKCVQNFQTNEFPYYAIQDTIKLSNSSNKNKQSLLSISHIPKQPFFLNDRLRIGLCETLLNTMKASKNQTLPQYQEIFHIMNQLDFQTFSQFLEIIVQKYKPICEKLLDREISIIKRFKKSFTESMNQQKLAEIYWHMRKSSKSSLSTDQDEKDLQFFAKIISLFSGSIFQKFKDSTFKFGYGKEENKRKDKISYLKKMLTNPTYENKYKSIKEEITEKEKQFFLWKLSKSTEILRQDILPIIEKISSSFNESLKKWQNLFMELEEIFGTERQQRFILFKQCSQFYKIFLSFEMLLQEQEATMIRTMSSLKTKPSLQSTRQMGITGRRRSSLKLPRGSLVSSLCLSTPVPPTFKSVFKAISPKFSFFSQMIDQNCPELKIHAKYSNLDSKLKLLHQKNKGGEITIEVKRESIWQDTVPFLNQQIAEKNVKIKIADQIGLDYGGLRRQWITLIVKELVNPNLGLFQLSVNGLSFQPSALSFLVPNHLYHFCKLGTLVGKALKQNWLLEINFTKSFLKHILGYTLYVQDLQDIDPSTTKSLLWILNNDVGEGDLGIDFTYEYDVLGKKKCIELIENGKEIQVTQDNKKTYVKKLANYKMTEQIRQQSKAFMNGIQKVVSYETLKIFTYKQLGIYLAGMPIVDVQQMKKYTRYQNFSPDDQNIKWFWQTLATYTEEQKANFLFFLTGPYKVPYGGFKQHPISINKMPASIDYLPVAHTCFSVIDLPEYSSKQKLGILLDKSIKQGKGFSVS